jgi:hypothetical protein
MKWSGFVIRCAASEPLISNVIVLEDHCQKRLFPAGIGGGAPVKSSDQWRVTSDVQGAAKANL